MRRLSGGLPFRVVPAGSALIEPIDQIRLDNQVPGDLIQFGTHLNHQHFPTFLFAELNQPAPEMADALHLLFQPDAYITALIADKILVPDEGSIEAGRRC